MKRSKFYGRAALGVILLSLAVSGCSKPVNPKTQSAQGTSTVANSGDSASCCDPTTQPAVMAK